MVLQADHVKFLKMNQTAQLIQACFQSQVQTHIPLIPKVGFVHSSLAFKLQKLDMGEFCKLQAHSMLRLELLIGRQHVIRGQSILGRAGEPSDMDR